MSAEPERCDHCQRPLQPWHPAGRLWCPFCWQQSVIVQRARATQERRGR